MRRSVNLTRYDGFEPKVDPLAYVHPTAQLLGDVAVGAESSIWPMTVLRGDNGWVRIGQRTSIQDGSVAHATTGVSNTTIGDDCTVGHKVVLHGCTVGHHCLVGIGSVVMDNVELGEWCFVAAGSLVTPNKKFEPRSFILGAPARRLRAVTEKEIGMIEEGVRAYRELTRKYRAHTAG